MPSSNDTRVRVDGFSKIIASDLPSSGLDLANGWVPAFSARETSMILRRSSLESRSRSRKCRSPGLSDFAVLGMAFSSLGAGGDRNCLPPSSQGLALGSTSLLAAARSSPSKLVDGKAKPCHDEGEGAGNSDQAPALVSVAAR